MIILSLVIKLDIVALVHQLFLVGSKAGYANTAESSVMVGFEAGMNATSGVENTIVGYRAGKGASSSTGSFKYNCWL